MLPDPEDPTAPLLTLADESSSVQVFPLLHRVRRDIEENIDTALSWSQLNAPDVNFAVVRPLAYAYEQLREPCLIFVLLLVRWHFLSLADSSPASASIHLSRASLAELLAMKLVRPSSHSPLELASALTTSWSVLSGAGEAALGEVVLKVGSRPEEMETPLNALEMAISSQSKRFLAVPLVQRVVEEIWAGKILYPTKGHGRELVPDSYKSQSGVRVYEARTAPWLDHYRLRVPRYRAMLEYANYVILLGFLMMCLHTRDSSHINLPEAVFILFALGMALDEFAASQEHGWSIYAANMWNAFDIAWLAMFLLYLGLRVRGLVWAQDEDRDLAFDVLACSAVVLFPRVAFYLLANNVIILALRSMIKEYIFFVGLCAICFSGFLFALWTLGSKTWQLRQIAWLMIQVWFGNTFLSFSQAESFHPVFGPILMVIFAVLVGLVATILISILSNTFAQLNTYATEEFLFQFTIGTLEGVNADALFSYQPPFNILAYLVLLPLTQCLSPRALHTTNVFLIRVTSFPVLLAIGIYERYIAPTSSFVESRRATGGGFHLLPRKFRQVAFVEAFIGSNNNDLLKAVFEAVTPTEDELLPEEEENDDIPVVHTPRHDELQLETPQKATFPANAGGSRAGSPSPARRASSRRRVQSTFGPNDSPLARFFTRRPASVLSKQTAGEDHDDLAEAVRRLERNVDGLREANVRELKELKERQARIEALLGTLVRGMNLGSGVTDPGGGRM